MLFHTVSHCSIFLRKAHTGSNSLHPGASKGRSEGPEVPKAGLGLWYIHPLSANIFQTAVSCCSIPDLGMSTGMFRIKSKPFCCGPRGPVVWPLTPSDPIFSHSQHTSLPPVP